MTVAEEVQRKLQLLLNDADAVAKTAKKIAQGAHAVDSAMGRRWTTKAEALLTSVFGANSHFVRDLRQHSAYPVMTEDAFQHLWGVAAGAVDAWRDGYVFNVRAEAEAEVQGGLLGAAAQDLAMARGMNEPGRRAAAVLAGSVLERHLRGLYTARGGTENPENLTIEPLSIELKKLGAIDEMQRKQIVALAAMRNSAAHGEVFSASTDDVRRMIESVTDTCARLR